MNEEMMTTMEETEEIEHLGTYEVIHEPESSNGGLIGKLVIGAAIVGAGAAALIYKNRAKLEQKRIQKLEKKGYVIYKPEEKDSNGNVVTADCEIVE